MENRKKVLIEKISGVVLLPAVLALLAVGLQQGIRHGMYGGDIGKQEKSFG